VQTGEEKESIAISKEKTKKRGIRKKGPDLTKKKTRSLKGKHRRTVEEKTFTIPGEITD